MESKNTCTKFVLSKDIVMYLQLTAKSNRTHVA